MTFGICKICFVGPQGGLTRCACSSFWAWHLQAVRCVGSLDPNSTVDGQNPA